MPNTITRTVMPGAGSTGDAMSPLIPFNMIVDTDVGLLSFVFKKYLDPRIFNPDFFAGKKVKDLALASYTRERENPLTLCITEEYEDMVDTFYKQFMEREYQNILDLSVCTEYFSLCRRFNNEADIHLTISCERQEEVDVLKKYESTKDCHIILSESLDAKQIQENYQQFYFKSISDSMPYATIITAKTVYYAGYGFNMNPEGGFMPHPALEIIRKRNNIMVTEVYNMKKLRGEQNG